MPGRVLLKKGVWKIIKSSKMTSRQAQKISDALIALESKPLSQLIESGKVKKLKIPNYDNIYAFRIGISERIIFSPSNGENIVHDIVDIKGNKLVKFTE